MATEAVYSWSDFVAIILHYVYYYYKTTQIGSLEDCAVL